LVGGFNNFYIFLISSGKKVNKKEGRIKGFSFSIPGQPQLIHNPGQGVF
jgi:hypothetical protein